MCLQIQNKSYRNRVISRTLKSSLGLFPACWFYNNHINCKWLGNCMTYFEIVSMYVFGFKWMLNFSLSWCWEQTGISVKSKKWYCPTLNVYLVKCAWIMAAVRIEPGPTAWELWMLTITPRFWGGHSRWLSWYS